MDEQGVHVTMGALLVMGTLQPTAAITDPCALANPIAK